jgi:putative ABC transport system permease protein
LAGWGRATGGFRYLRGGPFTGSYTALVDDVYVRTHHVDVGSSIDVLNHQFKVVGVVEHGKGARVFVPLETIQDLLAPGKCSVIFIKCTQPGLISEVRQRLRTIGDGALRAYEITPLSELTSLITPSSFVGLQQFLTVLVVFAGVINLLVIFLALYVQVLAQTRDIGILRALGATRQYLVRLFLAEACLLCLLGGLVSLGLYFLSKTVVLAFYPALHFQLPWGVLLRITEVTVLSGVLGAAYPALQATRTEPVSALNYE